MFYRNEAMDKIIRYDIVDDMCDNPNHFGSYTVNGFISILQEAKNGATSTEIGDLDECISDLSRLFPTT